jgi:hypothetical protein
LAEPCSRSAADRGAERWIATWKGDGTVADEQVAEPGETSTREEASQLLRTSYDSPAALARALTEHWEEATGTLLRGDLERYARDVMRDEQLAAFVHEQAEGNGTSADARLFRVILRLDPSATPQYMGYEISEAGLGGLATELDGPFPTQSAAGALRTLYTDHVLATYGEAGKANRFRELDETWHAEFAAWQEEVDRVKSTGGPDLFAALAWRARARILLALLDTKAFDAIRERARKATAQAGGHRWLGGLSADDPSIGKVLAAADIAEAVAAGLDDSLVRERAAAKAKRSARLSGVISLVVVALVVYGIIALSKGGNTTASAGPTGGLAGGGHPTATASLNPADQPVQHTGVVQKPEPLLATPDPNGQVVKQLPKNTVIDIIGSAKGGLLWVRLRSDPKTSGYVSSANVLAVCAGQCNVG